MTRRHAACTIVARNYIAQARVLARSFVAHHPDVQFYTLIIDGDDEDRELTGLGVVVLPGDLGLDTDELNTMCAMYDVMEYATAVKPAFLMYIHRSGARSALFLDPDIRVYDQFMDVFEAAEQSGLVLTPHALAPLPRDANRLSESDIMHAGIYNLGFIATGPSAYRFLGWWHDHLRTEAVVDLANALFTDQRWIDWAPAIESPVISRDSGLNAAYWNLHEREISLRGERWYAGDRPLRFYHFSGFDPAKPWLLSKHMGEFPRTLLSDHADLRVLFEKYGEELIELGHMDLRKLPYRNTFTPDGLKLTPMVRRLYRDSVLGSDGAAAPAPNPISEPAGFRRWLTAPSLAAGAFSFSRFEHAIWKSRIDVQRAFPDPLDTNAADFREWLDHDAGAANYFDETGVRRESLLEASHSGRQRPEYGWSLIGYAQPELGVGEAGRRLSYAVARTGLPWEMVGVSQGSLPRQEHRHRGALADHHSYNNTLLCANADQTAVLTKSIGLPRSGGRRVGYWFWELAAFPRTYAGAIDLLDEVWVPGEFSRAAIAEHTDKPVRIVPLPILLPREPTRFARRHFGLAEDKTVFLVVFDFLSAMRRKNPLGAIRAYTDAFGPDDGACLVVKSINGNLQPLERERVRMAARGRPDVLLWDHHLSSNEIRALTELADCVVSVHRAESYGLNLADAMAVGTPVIATGYSGNLAFMTEDTSFLIPHTLVEVGPGVAPYAADAVWAEPDLGAASSAMRTVADSPLIAQAVAERARRHVTAFSVERVAEDLAPLLQARYSTDSIKAGSR